MRATNLVTIKLRLRPSAFNAANPSTHILPPYLCLVFSRCDTAVYENHVSKKHLLLQRGKCDWKPIIRPVTEGNGKFPPVSHFLTVCGTWKDKQVCSVWRLFLDGDLISCLNSVTRSSEKDGNTIWSCFTFEHRSVEFDRLYSVLKSHAGGTLCLVKQKNMAKQCSYHKHMIFFITDKLLDNIWFWCQSM